MGGDSDDRDDVHLALDSGLATGRRSQNAADAAVVIGSLVFEWVGVMLELLLGRMHPRETLITWRTGAGDYTPSRGPPTEKRLISLIRASFSGRTTNWASSASCNTCPTIAL